MCICVFCGFSALRPGCERPTKVLDVLSCTVLTLSGAALHPAGLLEVISRSPGGSAKHTAQSDNPADRGVVVLFISIFFSVSVGVALNLRKC